MITLDNVFRSPYVDLFNQFVIKLQKNEYNEEKKILQQGKQYSYTDLYSQSSVHLMEKL